ncbi:AsmA family protein [Candidatus Omnitrophota bacterium]
MKYINVKGIGILAVVLIVIQLVFGLLISPFVGKIVVEQLNKHAGTKITVGKISVWPLTLSSSLKDLKVFDPDKENVRIAHIKKASMRLSPLRLLSKQLVLSSLSISGAEIDLKGEADGSFNVQKLAKTEKAKAEAKKKGSIFDRFGAKKDVFTQIYDMIKKDSSKEEVEKKKEEVKERKKVTKEVVELPRGRRVYFNTISDDYVFQIRSFVIKNAKINLETAQGEKLTVDRAGVVIKNLGVDPTKGARFDKLSIGGHLMQKDKPAGEFDFDYAQSFRGSTQKTVCNLSARNINLIAAKPIYQDSLPVDFTKGIISINSKTSIVNGNIDSSNSLTLKDQNITPKGGQQVGLGIIPLPTVCEAVNKVDPLKLKFGITGTVDSPQFTGFQEALMQLIKPYIADMAENIKEKGVSAVKDFIQKKMAPEEGAAGAAEGGVEGDAKQEAIDSIKSLFGDKQE